MRQAPDRSLESLAKPLPLFSMKSTNSARFQELDLSKNAYIFAGSAREEEWYRRVREALHPKAKYKRVSEKIAYLKHRSNEEK